MKALVATPEEASRLRALALGWCGTPWVAEGAIRGTGASCTGLPYGVLAEFGHDAPTPPSRLTIRKREILSTCREWLNAHPSRYAPVALEEIRAGDVLLFDCGIGHMAISLGGTEVLHSWQTTGAHIANFAEHRLASRLVAAWRPLA